MYAPIVLFAYNRPKHTLQTLQSLSKNFLADQSQLFIFADGAKQDATSEQIHQIEEVRAIMRLEKWCKTVEIIESETNLGLFQSITQGVSQVVNQFGKVIVLEDDLIFSKRFLRYMNEALEFYEFDAQVMHINGYFFDAKLKLPSTFFYNVPNPWGWATWQRAWEKFNPDAKDLAEKIASKKQIHSFDLQGSGQFWESLQANVQGKKQTWAISWYASIFLNNGFCLNPNTSLVQNIGFDGTGEHCHSTNLYHIPQLAESIAIQEIPLIENLKVRKKMRLFYKYGGFEQFAIFKHYFNFWKGKMYQTLPKQAKVFYKKIKQTSQK